MKLVMGFSGDYVCPCSHSLGWQFFLNLCSLCFIFVCVTDERKACHYKKPDTEINKAKRTTVNIVDYFTFVFMHV